MNKMKLKFSRRKKGKFVNRTSTVFGQKSTVVGLLIALSVLRILVIDKKIDNCKKGTRDLNLHRYTNCS